MSQTWKFNTVDLSTFGTITLIDDYLDSPERRGDDNLIPFNHGRLFVQKYYDSREIVFGIAIQAASAIALEDTLDTLRALLAPNTQKVLELTREDNDVRTALASVNKPINFRRLSRENARVTVEFVLAEPFWRSNTLVDESITVDTSPKDMDFTNVGTVQETNPVITLTGPLTNPVITNTTNGIVMSYLGAITAGHEVVISKVNGEYIALLDGVTNVIGNISHSGNAALMVLEVGLNELVITSSVTTTGVVKIEHYPPFL